VISDSLKAGKEKKTKDKKAAETEKIENVANDVDAADKDKKKAADKAGKAAKKEPEKKEPEPPKTELKGDPPVVAGKIEELVRWRESCKTWFQINEKDISFFIAINENIKCWTR